MLLRQMDIVADLRPSCGSLRSTGDITSLSGPHSGRFAENGDACSAIAESISGYWVYATSLVSRRLLLLLARPDFRTVE